MLRRLEKRIMVDLPSVDARKKMFEHFLPPKISSQQKGLEIVTQIDYDAVSKVNLLLEPFFYRTYLITYI